MYQTSVRQAHRVANVPCREIPWSARWSLLASGSGGPISFAPAAGHKLPFQVIKKEQASIPIGGRATRVQGLSLGVFSLSPRLSTLRAHTGDIATLRRDHQLLLPSYQEGERKSESCPYDIINLFVGGCMEQLPEIDTAQQDFVTCPWCGHAARDSWEFTDGEYDCQMCEKPFEVCIFETITYSTTKVRA